jgi:hypothetical protein
MNNLLNAESRLAWILEQTKTAVHTTDREDEGITVTLYSGVVIEITMDERIEKSILGDEAVLAPKFTVGSIECLTLGHWEPDEYDFVPAEETFSVYEAVQIALLQPKVWEIDSMLENIAHNEPILEAA